MSLAESTAAESEPISPEEGRLSAPMQQGARRWLRPFYKLVGIVQVVLRRMWYHFGLTLLALFGVVLAVGLVSPMVQWCKKQ